MRIGATESQVLWIETAFYTRAALNLTGKGGLQRNEYVKKIWVEILKERAAKWRLFTIRISDSQINPITHD